jgi:hypothetical protein
MGGGTRRPKNYWRDIENIKREIRPLIEKFGRFPSNNEMIKEHGTSLPKYIMKYHGGIIQMSKIMGVTCYDESIGRRVQGTWNKEDVIDEFLKIIKDKNLDYYPSRIDLKEWGYDIYVGITQTFSSYLKFKIHLKSLGIEFKQKPKTKIWDEVSIKKELQSITDQLGYFPSKKELDERGLSTIRRILSEDIVFKDKIIRELNVNLKPRKFSKIRSNGRWKWNEENVKETLLEIYSKYGRILSNKELKETGYGSVYTHIPKLDNDFLEKLNYFEDSKYLNSKDGHKVLSIYELLFDNFLSWNDIPHNTEGLISNDIKEKYRYDFKLKLNETDVYVEIWGYSRNRTELEKNYTKKRGLKENVYGQLNLKLLSIDDSVFEKSFQEMYQEFSRLIQQHDSSFKPKEINLNYFLYGSKNNIEDVVKEILEQVELNDGFFPSTTILKKQGLEGLISRIQKYGGVEVFKEKLGLEIKKHELKWTIELLKDEINKINGLSHVPSLQELKLIGRLDIQGGIQKNGGSKKVSKILNIPSKSVYSSNQPYLYQGKWSKTLIIQMIKEMIKELQRFPNETDFKSSNNVGLLIGIKRFFGGLRNLKKELGYFVKDTVNVKVGLKFGELTVVEITNNNSVFRVLSVCSCGMEYETRLDNFRDRYRKHNEKLSCGRCKKTKENDKSLN